jgi:hypothetical protein
VNSDDAPFVAELAAALKSISISEKQRAEIKLLYETPLGFPYTFDKKNAPKGDTITASRMVGSAVKKALGITSSLPYGMSLVGYGDQKTSTWRMNANFRAALDSLKWFELVEDTPNTESQTEFRVGSFEAWLIENGNSEKTASNYSGAIAGSLKDLAMQLTIRGFTTTQIESAANFKAFCQTHDESKEIAELNVRGKDMYRRALVWYAKYLTSRAQSVSLQGIEADFREEVKQSLTGSNADRKRRLADAETIPRTITVTSIAYVRNPDVVAQVLLDAKGLCQGCDNVAPFARKSDGTPYLEVHHRVPLSRGGEDTVSNAIALCPNCHRKMHFGI